MDNSSVNSTSQEFIKTYIPYHCLNSESYTSQVLCFPFSYNNWNHNLNNSKIWTTLKSEQHFLSRMPIPGQFSMYSFFIGYDTCLSNCCLRIVVCFCNISCISASQCPPKLYVLSHTYEINKQNELK